MEYREQFKEKLLKIDLIRDIGFADVSKYENLEDRRDLSEYLYDVKTAIVYIAKIDEVIQKYGKWYIVSLNNYLKQTNQMIIDILNKYEINASGIIDEHLNQNLVGKVSFRYLAVLAGLGTIGKNACLLHPIFGPNVLIGVVLINKYIPYDSPLIENVCINCDLCIKQCPTHAIQNNYFDKWRCKTRRKVLGKGCGTLCIMNCPIGKKL